VEHFKRFPLCVHCRAQGLVRAAKQLDHIIPLWAGGEDIESNRQGLCIECHDVKTRDEATRRSRGGGGESEALKVNMLETALDFTRRKKTGPGLA
jgi:5-methylcytosine-specific restriction protein A